jgi:hypothetical protein
VYFFLPQPVTLTAALPFIEGNVVDRNGATGPVRSPHPLEHHLQRIWEHSEVLHRVALVRTDVSEEISASIIRVKRVSELETPSALTSNRPTLRGILVTANVVSSTSTLVTDDGGATSLRNVGSYKSHTA